LARHDGRQRYRPGSEIWSSSQGDARYAEKYTGRRFVDVALELNLDCWPGRVIELPVAPIVSIDYVKYIDVAGTLQTLYDDTSSPTVGADRSRSISSPAGAHPAALGASGRTCAAATSTPSDRLYRGLRDRRLAEDLSVIPAELKLWLRVRLATLYENREALIVGTVVNEIPRDFNDALLDPLMLKGKRYWGARRP
jgi:hypothetical protein